MLSNQFVLLEVVYIAVAGWHNTKLLAQLENAVESPWVNLVVVETFEEPKSDSDSVYLLSILPLIV